MKNRMCNIFIIILAATLMMATGCAATKKQNIFNQEATEADVGLRIDSIRAFAAEGDCQSAEQEADRLFDKYDSDSLRSAIYTQLCICHLERGELARFENRAAELHPYIKDNPYLSRETQFVLEMSRLISVTENYAADVRIDNDLRQGFQSVLNLETSK